MSVDEARRHALHEAAAHNRWTAETAVTLMELLPPSGWGDVVRRSDLDALEHRMDLRFRLVDQRFDSLEEKTDRRFDSLEERIDQRFETFEERIDQRFEAFEERIDLRIERALNRSLRWTVGTIIALTGVVAATATVATIT